MNDRFKNIVKDYLTFSARERNGLILFFFIGLGIYLFSHYYTFKAPVTDKAAFQQELAQLKISVDSSRSFANYSRDEKNDDYYRPKEYTTDQPAKGAVFAFDPNTLNAEGWKRLGLRDKTITTIQKFISKGFKFRKADDLRKIYGLRKEDADRLVPYVRIAGNEASANTLYSPDAKPAFAKPGAPEIRKVTIVDINTADSSAFIALPGIGSKLAARIINFRQKLGGFSSVNQLAETYGLPDSTFQLVRPRLECNNPALKTININTADVNLLRTHPYLRWNIANAIINYRTQHGNYKSIEDLRKIDIITEDLYKKISPYLTL